MEEEAGDKAESKVEAPAAKVEESAAKVEESAAKVEESAAKAEEKKVEIKAQPKAAPAPKDNLSILDLAAGVLCLVVSSLLLGNSYVAYIGKSYNERFLRESIALAGKAATEGLDTPHVLLASYGSWAHCAFPGFFIERPEFVSFKDEITPELRVVTISSSTRVRVPAPFLIFDKGALDADDESYQHITFKNTYQFRLNNPKNIRGTRIRTPNGIIKVPGKSDAEAAKKNGAKTGAPPTPEVESAPASTK